MEKQQTIADFERKLTLGVLEQCSTRVPGKYFTSFSRGRLILTAREIANGLLQKAGLDKTAFVKCDELRLFLVHKRSRVLVAEIKLDAEEVEGGYLTKPSFTVVRERGKNPRTIFDLLDEVENFGNIRLKPRRNHGNY